MPKVMEPEIFDPSLPARLLKGGLNASDYEDSRQPYLIKFRVKLAQQSVISSIGFKRGLGQSPRGRGCDEDH